MKWHADIIAINNGFIVKYCDSEGVKRVCYEEKDDLDKEHIVEMFYELLSFFGEQGSKHDKKRIKITYEKQ